MMYTKKKGSSVGHGPVIGNLEIVNIFFLSPKKLYLQKDNLLFQKSQKINK